jgi:hypothetical protein
MQWFTQHRYAIGLCGALSGMGFVGGRGLSLVGGCWFGGGESFARLPAKLFQSIGDNLRDLVHRPDQDLTGLSRIPIIAFGILFLFIGSASAQVMSQGKRIEFYLQFAFGASDVLRKFADRPQATLICPSGKCEKGLIDQTWKTIPSGDELLFAKSYASSMPIALVPDIAEGNRIAARETEKLKEFTYREWGDQRCKSIHFAKGNVVKKFIVIADPKEGHQANAICFAMELVKGSGMAFWRTYDFLLKQIPEKQNHFILNCGAFLKFHWATIAKPGASKQDVRDAWREEFGL